MAHKITYAQERALKGLRDHQYIAAGVVGLSAHGGLSNTVAALIRNGYIIETPDAERVKPYSYKDQYTLTDTGKAAIA